MVVSVSNGTRAGAQGSPVVWRQPRLPGEDTLAQKERDPSQSTDATVSITVRNTKGSTEMCYVVMCKST